MHNRMTSLLPQRYNKRNSSRTKGQLHGRKGRLHGRKGHFKWKEGPLETKTCTIECQANYHKGIQ